MRGPRKILILDHVGDLDRFICKVLGEELFFIYHAENLYDFEKCLFSEQPDILIVNIHLPQLHLPSFLSFKQSSSRRPFMIFAIQRDVQKYLSAGVYQFADDLMIAPFTGFEVSRKIAAAEFFLQQQENRQPELHVIAAPKPQIIKVAEPKPEPRSTASRRNSTLLLIKIHGFEALTSDLDHGECATFVTDMLRLVDGEISRLGGRVASYQGDVLVAFFANSTLFPNHRVHAVQAAMQLQLLSMFWHEKLNVPSGHELLLSCVLHTTMLTTVEHAHQLTMINASLPVALRMVDHAAPGSILATADCYQGIRQHLRLGEHYLLEDLTGPFHFARITAASTRDYCLTGSNVFQALPA